MTVEIRAIRSTDDRRPFQSGDEALDLYFHRFAGQNQFRHHIGVTYVAVHKDRILGFVTVSPATLDADDLPSGHRMPPYPVPVLRIARLAVHQGTTGKGIGRALLRFCIELAEQMRVDLGCVGLLVDAKPGAVGYYEQLGFARISALEGNARQVPVPILLYLPLGSVPRP